MRTTRASLLCLAVASAVLLAPAVASAATRYQPASGVKTLTVRNSPADFQIGVLYGGSGDGPNVSGVEYIDVQTTRGSYGYGRTYGSPGNWNGGRCGWVLLTSATAVGTVPDPGCPSDSTLDPPNIFSPYTYQVGCSRGCVQPAKVVSCANPYAYGNYDPASRTFSNRYGTQPIGRGTTSYPGVTQGYELFGRRYKTKDGQAVLIKDTSSPAGNGYSLPEWFFMRSECLHTFWSSWEDMGGTTPSDPDVSSLGSGQLNLFRRGSDNALWHKSFNNGWSGWSSLGGSLSSGPTAVSWSSGRIDVFARGTDNTLVHKWWDNGSWSGWESLGGYLTSAPDVSSWGSGRLDVFARGADNSLQHIWFDGRWSGWESLGGILTSSPGAVSWGPNRIDVFVRGNDNGLWHLYFDGAWRPWEGPFGVNNLTSGPDVASDGSGRLSVFATRPVTPSEAPTRQEMHRIWFDGGWQRWESLYGRFGTGPGAVSWGPGRIDVFAGDEGGEVDHVWYTGG